MLTPQFFTTNFVDPNKILTFQQFTVYNNLAPAWPSVEILLTNSNHANGGPRSQVCAR